MIPDEIIILAGGAGTRLKELTGNLPKCLVPVAGKPFLHYLMQYLVQQGVQRYVFALGIGADAIRHYLMHDEAMQAVIKGNDLELVFSEEAAPLGTGGALLQALPQCHAQHVLATNADSIFLQPLEQLAKVHLNHHAAITLSLTHKEDASRFGLVQTDDTNRITHFAEKQAGSSGWINAGMYMIDRRQVNIPAAITHCSLENDMLPQLLAAQKLYAAKGEGYFTDIGIPADYLAAQTELLQWIKP